MPGITAWNDELRKSEGSLEEDELWSYNRMGFLFRGLRGLGVIAVATLTMQPQLTAREKFRRSLQF